MRFPPYLLRNRALWRAGGLLAMFVAVGAVAVDSAVVRVTSMSMADTLCDGDYVLVAGHGLFGRVLSFDPDTRRIVRGDVVIVRRPPVVGRSDHGGLLIKRAIALGGDTVRIDRGVVFVNGRPLTEPYAHHKSAYAALVDSWPRDADGDARIDVPKDHYFLMGDNRDESLDSRMFGSISAKDLVGPVVARWRRRRPSDRCRPSE
jgi:signal peptidase I